MEQFDVVMKKHGEHGVQALLENWERYVGLRQILPMALEDRWDRFIRETNYVQICAAA